MTEKDVKEDFEALRLLIRKSKECPNHTKVFKETNENVKGILNQFDIKNKSVLTVLASGDQALNILNRKASIVELFDINKLTIYYYYIRIWLIKYFDKFYLDIKLSEILNVVRPENEDEANALLFWQMYYKEFGDNLGYFFYKERPPLAGKIKDLSYLKERLKDSIKFYNIDLGGEINLNKKYDIIYASNVSKWIGRSGISNLDIYIDNLSKLLNDNGIVICSNVTTITNEQSEEVKNMSKSFDYHSLEPTNDICFFKIPGYYYTKKRI